MSLIDNQNQELLTKKVIRTTCNGNSTMEHTDAGMSKKLVNPFVHRLVLDNSYDIVKASQRSNIFLKLTKTIYHNINLIIIKNQTIIRINPTRFSFSLYIVILIFLAAL